MIEKPPSSTHRLSTHHKNMIKPIPKAPKLGWLCPRKISADDAAALTFGAGGRTVERIQRVSEAEVEQFGRRVGAGWISGDLIGSHWIWMGFWWDLIGLHWIFMVYFMECIFGQVWVMKPILGAHWTLTVSFWPSPFRVKLGVEDPRLQTDWVDPRAI